jgi:hypothetical protein
VAIEPAASQKKRAGIHGTLEQLGAIEPSRDDRDGVQEREHCHRVDLLP